MHFANIIAGVTTIFASVAAAQPTVRQAPEAYANLLVVNSVDHSQQPVRIPLAQLTTLDYDITKLELESLSVNVPDIPAPNVEDIVCQRYKDQYGVQFGSAEFTKGQPALIATNPVEFGWVLCYHKNKSS